VSAGYDFSLVAMRTPLLRDLCGVKQYIRREAAAINPGAAANDSAR
jgi:hypothetical protein